MEKERGETPDEESGREVEEGSKIGYGDRNPVSIRLEADLDTANEHGVEGGLGREQGAVKCDSQVALSR
jgi:hypothetical protein